MFENENIKISELKFRELRFKKEHLRYSFSFAQLFNEYLIFDPVFLEFNNSDSYFSIISNVTSNEFILKKLEGKSISFDKIKECVNKVDIMRRQVEKILMKFIQD